MVPEEGVEPTHSCLYGILSPARLPVPPLRLESFRISPDGSGFTVPGWVQVPGLLPASRWFRFQLLGAGRERWTLIGSPVPSTPSEPVSDRRSDRKRRVERVERVDRHEELQRIAVEGERDDLIEHADRGDRDHEFRRSRRPVRRMVPVYAPTTAASPGSRHPSTSVPPSSRTADRRRPGRRRPSGPRW